MEKFLTGVFAVIGGLAVYLFFSFLLAYPTMWIWNDLSTKLFHGNTMKEIDVTTAFMLMALCSILFKGSNSGVSKS
jgi:hypothetical protein